MVPSVPCLVSSSSSHCIVPPHLQSLGLKPWVVDLWSFPQQHKTPVLIMGANTLEGLFKCSGAKVMLFSYLAACAGAITA